MRIKHRCAAALPKPRGAKPLLTGRSSGGKVWPRTFEYTTSRAEALNPLHDSNPTLVLAVGGLRTIINPRGRSVLRESAALTTHCLLGPQCFQVLPGGRS